MKRFNMMVAKPYLDKQSGQTKTRWVKTGTAVETTGQDGQLKIFGDIDAAPVGSWWDGSYNLFEHQIDNQSANIAHSNSQQQQGYREQRR